MTAEMLSKTSGLPAPTPLTKQHNTHEQKTTNKQDTGGSFWSPSEQLPEAKAYSMNESEDQGFRKVQETDPTFYRFPNTV